MGLRASVAVFVVSLLLSLVIWAPVSVIATVAERQLGFTAPVNNLQGTIWQGSGNVSLNGMALNAQWQYQFPLAWQLTVGGDASGELVGSVAPITMAMSGLNGSLNAGWLLDQVEPFLGGIYLDAPGKVKLSNLNARWQNGQLAYAQGTLSYDGGVATYNLFSDVDVNVPPLIAVIEPQDNNAIEARLLTQDGLLLAESTIAEGQAQYKAYNALLIAFGMGSGNPGDLYLENQMAMPALGM